MTAPTESTARRAKRWRIARWVVLGVACTVTLLGLVLVVAAYRNDAAIEAARGTANAEVLSVDWARTIVRFETPDGLVHISQDGVLYPAGLREGQQLLVEYDVTNPNTVRVAERTAQLTLLPVATTVLITWAVAGPLLWWIRRRTSAQSSA